LINNEKNKLEKIDFRIVMVKIFRFLNIENTSTLTVRILQVMFLTTLIIGFSAFVIFINTNEVIGGCGAVAFYFSLMALIFLGLRDFNVYG